MDRAESVIQELLECIDLLGNGLNAELEKRIPDPAYRRNFVALARRLAPDGDAVRAVGFTAEISGTERQVLLKRTAKELSPLEPFKEEPKPRALITVQGILKFADSTKAQHNRIKIVDADDKQHTIPFRKE